MSAHILVFPYPAQGHMLPLLDLTGQLSLRGITITILSTPNNVSILTSLLNQHPSIQTLILPFPTHPSLPPGIENVKDIGNHAIGSITNALCELHHPIIKWFQSHPSPPNAIISDFFLGWTLNLATQLGVPRIAFYTSGAFLASVVNDLLPNMRLLQQQQQQHNLHVSLPSLPNSPSFPHAHLPPVAELEETMLANNSSWGCIFNTFDGLERVYLDHVRKRMGHVRIWAVGPLLRFEDIGSMERDLLTWLDGCPDGSVVYVCFGSQVFFTQTQMEALAAGLESSGIRFVWIVKVANGFGVVPTGFEDRVSGTGLVIKSWAPQVSILSHRAIGGFLTHCGWNSVLEGIVAGVLLFAWPMVGDQFVNAKLVDDMGVAVRVCEGVDAVPDSDKLGRVIAGSMDGNRSERIRVMELRNKALAAIKEGGSSLRDLNGLVKELCGLDLKIKEI